ncbi:MAG: hypothetical protein ACREWG_11430 [Gammaproteobacteria bacterium]
MRKTLTHAFVFAAFLCVASVASADPAVTGTFMGNGKDGKLVYAFAKKGEPFNGKETVEVTLSEKDTGGNPFKAAFGDFGSALVLTINSEGTIIGCQVVHTAHQKRGFTSLGSIKTENYKLDQGILSAKVTTGGEQDTFGEKWAVDLTFKTPVK